MIIIDLLMDYIINNTISFVFATISVICFIIVWKEEKEEMRRRDRPF